MSIKLASDVDELAGNFQLFKEKPLFVAVNELAEFEGRPDAKFYDLPVDYDALFKAYDIEPTDFRELITNLKNHQDLNPYMGAELLLNFATSADLRAEYAGKIPKGTFFQLAAIGMVRTKDADGFEHVVVGERGGEGEVVWGKTDADRVDRFGTTLLGFPPGGSIKFQTEYDNGPVVDTMAEEFEEELGYFEMEVKRVIGTFEAYKPGPTGIKIICELQTDAKLEQIQSANITANSIYRALRRSGVEKDEAQQELKERRLPVNAWEHTYLCGLPNDAAWLKNYVKLCPQRFCGIGAGALLLYAMHLESERTGN